MKTMIENLEEKIRQAEARLTPPERAPVWKLTEEEATALQACLESPQPLEIEIGTGKGRFMLARAEAHPDKRFIAVDRAGKWLHIGRERAQKRGLSNIVFLKTDACELLRQKIPSGRTQSFHIYFPDPWPKKRHNKRRLLTADFLVLLYSRLKPGGRLFIATDFTHYHESILEAAAEASLPWAMRESHERLNPEDGKTNYEMKYEAAGRTLHYLEFRKP